MASNIQRNPHMTAVMGVDDYTKEHFPGIFIAEAGTTRKLIVTREAENEQ